MNFPTKHFFYDQNQMTGKMYNSQMKFILVLDHKDNFELSGDQARDTAQTIYKNRISQMRRISTEFMHGE